MRCARLGRAQTGSQQHGRRVAAAAALQDSHRMHERSRLSHCMAAMLRASPFLRARSSIAGKWLSRCGRHRLTRRSAQAAAAVGVWGRGRAGDVSLEASRQWPTGQRPERLAERPAAARHARAPTCAGAGVCPEEVGVLALHLHPAQLLRHHAHCAGAGAAGKRSASVGGDGQAVGHTAGAAQQQQQQRGAATHTRYTCRPAG